jgi:hypothetical protein
LGPSGGLAPIHDRRDADALADGIDGPALAASLMVGTTRDDIEAASRHVARSGNTDRDPEVLDDEGATE